MQYHLFISSCLLPKVKVLNVTQNEALLPVFVVFKTGNQNWEHFIAYLQTKSRKVILYRTLRRKQYIKNLENFWELIHLHVSMILGLKLSI
jgi:hypothetical protein